LIINTGSASKKYAFYEGKREIMRAHFEKEGVEFVVTVEIDGGEEKKAVSIDEFTAATEYIINHLLDKKIIEDSGQIDVTGLRIVAPGTFFLENRIIDDEYLAKLQQAKQEAPLHIGPVIVEIDNIQKVLPSIKMVGISDSAFHKTMSPEARHYSIPESDASQFDIYRYGYHGISFSSISRKIEKIMGRIPPRTIICHLGSGSSLAALKNGESIDTTMGFTPLEGLVMSTRIGNIDAGAVIYLAQKTNMKLESLESYFNFECGLKGLSGKSDDIRELIDLEEKGDEKAKLALDTFAHHVKKYIGAYTAELNGLDLLVFSATVGERSYIMRSRICDKLENMGIILDAEKNKQVVSREGFINADDASFKIAVIPTNEMEEIRLETEVILGQ
ncbi:MAG: acetate/propionate family kinase, partial [Candidatus Paceibacterota bacterium]